MSVNIFRLIVIYLIMLVLLVRVYFVATHMQVAVDFSSIFAQTLTVFILLADGSAPKND